MARKKYKSPEMQGYSLSRETFRNTSGGITNKIEGGGGEYED